ncbi:chondroitin sulfate synthase 1 isoform X2 [Cephus cinctus]|uniref:Hexosyltransferase n=1 Tax=Cephus cinctus TaxID=211228 RepID=A0AAJ7C0L8_CEPCN|nr:chondroitin sulfate synthase 1 isoform X2 [Cephus cinctus]
MGQLTEYPVMRKRRGLASGFVGLGMGLVLGLILVNYRSSTSPLLGSHVNSSRPTPSARSSGPGPVDLRESDRINASASSLVFVGVMTAQKYLDTRAKAVYETWVSSLPGRMAFFSSESSTVPESCPELPLVPLPKVDDSYPPQKKSFLMLQYMWQHFGEKFEWFLRADDDVYVRTDRLERLLRSVDSRRARYIGQAGRGNSEEFGLLSLEYDENFCMGGPGVVMSRETLKRIVPHIKYCLKNLYTTHEDVELGRCVQKYAGIPCTWSYEMQSILYHNSSGDQAFTGNLKRKEVHRAITLHPVKSPPHMYRLHNYMRELRIQELQHERVQLHRDIQTMAKQLDIGMDRLQDYILAKDVPLFPIKSNSEDYLGDTLMLGVPAGLRAFKPSNAKEVVPWDFLSRSEYSLADSNPRRRIHSDVKEGLEDITREVMASINACSRQRGRVVEERSALYGYRRVDAFGADTILDLLLVYRKYRGRKVTLPVRRHVYLHQHFTGLEIREVEDLQEVDVSQQRANEKSLKNILRGGFLNLNFNGYQDSDPILRKTIHFVLPLSGRYEAFQRFLNNYEDVCLRNNERTQLLLILYPEGTGNSFNKSLSLVQDLKYRHPGAVIEVLHGSREFSRAKALHQGASTLQDEDLLFFIDVDIAFARDALLRIRLNTVKGRRVYFPVVYSQFDPRVVLSESSPRQETFAVDETLGYWRQFGFGIVSLFKADYLTVGGFDLSILGWGKEDVDLYEKMVKSDLNVFRAADTQLVHVFHEVECDRRLPSAQLSMCKGTRADTYAGTVQLANLIYAHPEYLQFAKTRREKITNPAG